MDPATLADHSAKLATEAAKLADQAASVASEATQLIASGAAGSEQYSFLALFSLFILACFVGFYVVWSVTPALHSPLMAVTNAISSVIIVGGLLAAGPSDFGFAELMGTLAVALVSVNIFGGFIVTNRMLAMFKKKEKKVGA